MIRLLIVSALFYAVNSLDLGNAFVNVCLCKILLTQADCVSEFCTWSNGACSAPACSTYNASTCPLSTNCVYFNGQCVTWTKCSDYNQTSGNTTCLNLGGNCAQSSNVVSNTSTSVLYSCTDQIINCTSLSATDCASQSACYYNSTATVCRAKTCTDVNNQISCSYINPGNLFQATLCLWNATTSTCGNAADISSLTASTCNTFTQRSYLWNPTTQKCVQCSTISNWDMVICMTALIGLILS